MCDIQILIIFFAQLSEQTSSTFTTTHPQRRPGFSNFEEKIECFKPTQVLRFLCIHVTFLSFIKVVKQFCWFGTWLHQTPSNQEFSKFGSNILICLYKFHIWRSWHTFDILLKHSDPEIFIMWNYVTTDKLCLQNVLMK